MKGGWYFIVSDNNVNKSVACNVMTDSKLLSELTVLDLERHPCWTHYVKDGDEFVLPSEKDQISEIDTDDFIVLTEFILHDKTKHLGFSSPKDTSGLDYIQPVLVTSKGHLPLYFDKLDNVQLQDLTKEILNKSAHEVFPLTFITRIKCDNEYFQAQVEYFNFLMD